MKKKTTKLREGAATLRVRQTKRGHDASPPKDVLTKRKTVPVVAEEPCAMAGVTLGYTISENYQSVHVSVSVTLPWDADDIAAGLSRAREEADAFIAENDKYARRALRMLVDT